MLVNDLDKNRLTKANWLKAVKDCLFSLGFQDAWTNENVNETYLLRFVKQKLIENFRQEWLFKVQTSDRFSTYRLFKVVHQAEKYINDITIKKFRDCLIRFRFGINELAANKRYHAVSNTCPFCPESVENEDHFLCECPAYSIVRTKYLHVLLKDIPLPDVGKILSVPDAKQNRKLAMYIFYALKEREQLLDSL
jgi:hypothetical protein